MPQRTVPALSISLLLWALCTGAFAQPVDMLIDVPSRTLTDPQFLRGETMAGDPVTLNGQLVVPKAEGRQPVVILLHGSDGPRSQSAWVWQDHLNRLGIATFRLDSYSARGLTDVSQEQDRFGQFVQLYDAYRATEVLVAHPRVDGERIVLMGFSRGGTAALYSALDRFRTRFGPVDGKIVAHLALYPACNFELDEDLAATGAPIRLFHGTADDWTPLAPCRIYVDRLRAAGRDAELFAYEGARHAFDNALSPAYVHLDAAQTTRNCTRREKDGLLVNAATGRPFAYTDPCVERGASVQFNPQASEAARRSVEKILDRVFSPPQ